MTILSCDDINLFWAENNSARDGTVQLRKAELRYHLTTQHYAQLAAWRRALRTFLRFSERAAADVAGHLSHDLPCSQCGHAMHTYLPCSDTCGCTPPAFAHAA